MYKVTIQAAAVPGNDWKVVATGTWIPGEAPRIIDEVLPPELLADLFNVVPQEADKSGRNQVTFGNTYYAVVFRKLSSSEAGRTWR